MTPTVQRSPETTWRDQGVSRPVTAGTSRWNHVSCVSMWWPGLISRPTGRNLPPESLLSALSRQKNGSTAGMVSLPSPQSRFYRSGTSSRKIQNKPLRLYCKWNVLPDAYCHGDSMSGLLSSTQFLELGGHNVSYLLLLHLVFFLVFFVSLKSKYTWFLVVK